MADEKIKVGDIGTELQIYLTDQDGAVDISSATTMEFNFKKPNDSTITRTATHITDGTDGGMKYAFIAADLDLAGDWLVEAFVITSGGQWTGDCSTFTVYDVCV